MIREIVKIDEELCDGCGLCIPNCHEGALQIIDEKAILVSDLMCDGLGACLGHCPQGAITIEKREAEEYNETVVIAEMVNKGKNVVIAHLQHLKEHNETQFLKEGVRYLVENKEEIDFDVNEVIYKVHNNIKKMESNDSNPGCGCMGSQEMSFENQEKVDVAPVNMGELKSELRQWPVQMHLINPNANYFQNADVVITADCVAFALGNYHQKFLKDRSIGIACPKLDSQTEIYIDKFRRMIDEAKINTFTVMIMEVPCCGGLIQMVKTAVDQAERQIPVKLIVVGIQGDILSDEWV
ncbi:MAG: 4Fe-4S binding protein [Bacteroidetes bacterium]|nr:4Fe-4S binding protein [Bacteroidota bacterium]MBT6686098.1 4Fe-4S binding protein [Bacteroidota bacterium]MBT7142009.1 4Fe-4S binding protein [Bacteroidota bacterium]MBT7490120.1 4Fe-4S binding protein [Bacteroidota bacterium]